MRVNALYNKEEKLGGIQFHQVTNMEQVSKSNRESINKRVACTDFMLTKYSSLKI